MNVAYILNRLGLALLWLAITVAGGYLAYLWLGLEWALAVGVIWFMGTMAELSTSTRKARR